MHFNALLKISIHFFIIILFWVFINIISLTDVVAFRFQILLPHFFYFWMYMETSFSFLFLIQVIYKGGLNNILILSMLSLLLRLSHKLFVQSYIINLLSLLSFKGILIFYLGNEIMTNVFCWHIKSNSLGGFNILMFVLQSQSLINFFLCMICE